MYKNLTGVINNRVRMVTIVKVVYMHVILQQCSHCNWMWAELA